MMKVIIYLIAFACLFMKADSMEHPAHPTDGVWSSFCYMLDKMPADKAETYLKDIFENNMNTDDYTCLADITERYLHYRDSPYQNEKLYIFAMKIITKSPSILLWDRVRYVENLALAERNMVGSQALDFNYNTVNGRTGHLYGIKAKYLLLLFFNPDCDECDDLINRIKSSPDISCKVKLAAFHGNDLMLKLQTYDLSMVPTLYLLDENKSVLLKNASLDDVKNYFHRIRK